MLVYRLDCHQSTTGNVGRGPYRDWDEVFYSSVGSYLSDSLEDDAHPLPSDDMKLRDTAKQLGETIESLVGGRYFGFEDKESLLRWFFKYGRYAEADERGFGISVYEVPERSVCLGSFQLVFDRGEAALVDIIPLI